MSVIVWDLETGGLESKAAIQVGSEYVCRTAQGYRLGAASEAYVLPQEFALKLASTKGGTVVPFHPNTQLAAIAVDDNWNELEVLNARIQFDEATADPKALEINHYSSEKWADAKPEAQVMREFLALIERHKTIEMTSKRTGKPYKVARLAGHNVINFDAPRLRDMWQRCYGDAFFPVDHRQLDTLQRILWWAAERGIRAESFTLEKSLEMLGIKSDWPLHDALADCRACIAIAKFMAEQTRQKEAA